MWALITHYDGGYSLSYPLSSHGVGERVKDRHGRGTAMAHGLI
jgi:hypothetical protein